MSIVVNKGQKQLIEFTKERFEALLKLVYLGNWMANAHRDEPIAEYERLEIRGSEKL